MHIFHLEIPFGNVGLPFKKSRFPEKISVRGVKITLSINNPSKFFFFFFGGGGGVNGKQPLFLLLSG